ncbi:DUF29 domain-containing protein [Zavarzinia compransoris]|uniref:DUF29 domain-containing protein n=1 Tax=Zavarzinia compransoris TaxID=1264899 RepID=A0A317E1H2_9PROT|nr:DUF29 domain-containing protein [Zavarzinia compransoris]PWR20908.1 DUF29 domain-containing protein [Zavarzinia compransoris]TDP44254.1 uncharacterized protein DUF29 [Zavarzinia compransoris]
MPSSAGKNSLYEHDFYAWALEQAALLRAGDMSAADIEHIAEEIESMGKAEKRELVSRLAVLLLHLLKWRFQPAGQCTSWRLSIKEQRVEVADHLADNPSLRARMPEALAAAYRRACLGAARETALPEAIFPPECPWPFERIMEAGFWPAAD